MRRGTPGLRQLSIALLLVAFSSPSLATQLTVTDPAGQPLATVMVRERPADGPQLDTSDNGYPAPGVAHTVVPEITRFSDVTGRVEFAGRSAAMEYLVRKPGYQDFALKPAVATPELNVTLVPESDPIRLAEAKPASAWLGALDLGDRESPEPPSQPSSRLRTDLRTLAPQRDRRGGDGALHAKPFPDGVARFFRCIRRRSPLCPSFASAPTPCTSR